MGKPPYLLALEAEDSLRKHHKEKNLTKHYSSSMSPAEKIEALRAAFQSRVGNLCLEPFCITEQEAQDLLNTNPIQSLLEAFTRCGIEVKRFRDESMTYLDESAILQCLAKHVARQHEDHNRATSGLYRTRKADYAKDSLVDFHLEMAKEV